MGCFEMKKTGLDNAIYVMFHRLEDLLMALEARVNTAESAGEHLGFEFLAQLDFVFWIVPGEKGTKHVESLTLCNPYFKSVE